MISVFVTLLVDPEPHHHPGHDRPRWPGHRGSKLTYEQLKQVLLETPRSEKAEEWSRYYTEGAHLAGQNYSQVRIPVQYLGIIRLTESFP